MESPYPQHTDLGRLLPPRGITAHKVPSGEGGAFGAVTLLAAMLLGLVGWLGPSIVEDWRMRGDAVAAQDLTVRDVACRSWLGLLRFCGATLAAPGETNESRRRVRYAFFSTRPDQPSTALRSRSDPARITTDLGVATVHSRLAALLLFCGIVLFSIGAAASVWRRGSATRRAVAALSGQTLTPVVVAMVRNNHLPPRRRLWVFLYEDGGRQERALAEWPSRWQPLFATLDQKWALALRGPAGGPPMLLDAKLESLDLTEAERNAFYEAFRAAFTRETERAATISP